MTRVAYLGPRGTYSEAAALRFAPGAERVPSATVAAAVSAVERGEADVAVCAIENSIEGGVNETIDQLLRPDFPLKIAGEVVLPIRHALVGAAGVDLAAPTLVYSHPQALAQCRRRLAELVPAARPVAALSTAAAIEASVSEPGSLGIGNAFAAELYGARVYADDVGDEPGNETRFVAVAHADHEPTGDDKTSLAFTTQHDRPGSLVEVLLHFSRRGINMTHIESRPTRRQLGTYVFLVDVHGHRDDATLADAVNEVSRVTSWLRVLGSYPRWPGTPDGEPTARA
ncbi:MAG: prephenate dehydratase [Chloroflexi bacterium]|nr:prephenate dehydratase [Chloroflexota bacterium]MDA1003350.1 prephenate dehydratase [Chloroflexota bacterium]MQC27784.1 prephenate dehydratase [Chloroflexota bacterium]